MISFNKIFRQLAPLKNNAEIPGTSDSVGRIAILLAIVFFIGRLPAGSRYVLHHPDERHHIDAAIEMLLAGKYLTPRQADGSYHYRKPILTYWCVLASYMTLESTFLHLVCRS